MPIKVHTKDNGTTANARAEDYMFLAMDTVTKVNGSTINATDEEW